MLSATLVFPITANAAQGPDAVPNISDSIIDRNTTTYRYTGTATKAADTKNEGDYTLRNRAANNADLAAWNQALAQSVVKTGTFSNHVHKVDVYDAAADKEVPAYFQFLDDEGWGWDFETENDGTTFSYFLTIYKSTYKNTDTGETSSKVSDLTGVALESVNVIPKKRAVYTGGVEDIALSLRAGNVAIKNVKSSNKKVIQARAITNTVNKTSAYYELSKDLKGYYYTLGTEKFYVPEGTKVNQSSATVTLRVFGKKAGKAVVSFDIVDINGSKTGSGKITVISSKTKPIASITFAGKSLDQGDVIGASNNKYIYNKQDINAIHSYTTAKSGKLKVTPSDGYKLVRIQVGKLEKYKYDSSQDPSYASSNYSTASKTSTSSKTIETTNTHPVDLNKDGDYDDIVDGVNERYVTYRYKTVKNNKKITLSKVTSYWKSTSKSSTSYTDNTEANYSSEDISGATDAANKAPTSILITLYNKSAKEYVDVEYVIYKKVKNF